MLLILSGAFLLISAFFVTKIEILQNKIVKKPLDPNTAPRYMKYIPFWA